MLINSLVHVTVVESYANKVFEGLISYSYKVKRINRGYITRYTIQLTLRGQDYSNMIIEEIKFIIVITTKATRLLLLLLLFLTFSALVANPKKLLYTVANPARGLLNKEKKRRKSQAAPPPPPPARAARSEKIK